MNLSTMSYRRKYMIPLRFEYIQSKNKKKKENQSLIARIILLWGLEIAMVASLSLYCNLILGLKLFQRIHVNASFPRKRIKRFGFTIYSQYCA